MSRSRWRDVALDFLERMGWSAGQLFFATLLAGGMAASAADLPWKYAGTIAIGGAVSSFVLTVVQYLAGLTNLSFWPDALVRLLKTFVSSFAASIAAAGVLDILTFDFKTAFNVAFLATIGALGKGLLARESAKATPDARGPSPSTLPTETYEAAVTAPVPSLKGAGG
ncbi:hypothetical protein F1D05_00045 [Kribbella qitaiheensis]|uniref:Uncharacterized protein n=1 Tax=Kribbella qitaiheensis TaxID=1544730 RepID=A0A7G6WRG8_9ACTN|nr:hypothetical protein [Kribbella qitaiheensis]QNE16583.1 hypothetical protein F1D05_00045 [Kribbella qitaiheensis]